MSNTNAEGEDVELGQGRLRTLTERGMEYQIGQYELELKRVSVKMSSLLNQAEIAISDTDDLVELKDCRTKMIDLRTKMDDLDLGFSEYAIPKDRVETRIDLSARAKLLERQEEIFKKINQRIFDLRMEVQSNVSCVSRASIVSGTRRGQREDAVRVKEAEMSQLAAGHAREDEPTGRDAYQLLPMITTKQEPSTSDETLKRLVDLLTQSGENRLPLPEPDIFYGDRFQYHLWIQSFEDLIESRVSHKADCLFHLSRYLRGEAREAVRGLLPLRSAEAYMSAKSILKERFGDPFLLYDSYRQRLSDWPPIPEHDGAAITRFADFLFHCVEASKMLPSLNVLNDPRENQKLLKKLPSGLTRQWANFADEWRVRASESSTGSTVDSLSSFYPPLSEFAGFVRRAARMACNPITSVQALKNVKEEARGGQSRTRAERRVNLSTLTSERTPEMNQITARRLENEERGNEQRRPQQHCSVCGDQHRPDQCETLLKAVIGRREQIVAQKGLCYRCLRRGHRRSQCRLKKRCDTCGGAHSTLLHRHHENGNEPVRRPPHMIVSHATKAKEETLISHTMIVPVWLYESSGNKQRLMTYAVLDEQSDASFITNKCLNDMGLKGQDVKVRLSTMLGEQVVDSKKVTGLQVRSHDEGEELSLPVLFSRDVIPCKRELIPRIETAQRWPHLHQVATHMMPYDENIEIGLLIGTDCIRGIRPREIVSGSPTEPYAMRTALGWGIVGNVSLQMNDEQSQSCNGVVCFRTQTRVKELMFSEVSKMVNLDFSEKLQAVSLSQNDKKFLKTMDEGVTLLPDGHFQAPLPLKCDKLYMPPNRHIAVKRLEYLRKRLERDEQYYRDYCKYISGMIENNFCEEIESSNTPENVWYIPHHGVYHAKKGKFRVVFDCSSSMGSHSLNQNLLQGPDLTNSLLGILCRFREQEVVVSCDIKKMFFQIKVDSKHRDLLRFLWWKDGNLQSTPKEFRMTVHLFGATSSPGVANYALKRVANLDSTGLRSQAKDFIVNDFYVDDGLRSVSSINEAKRLIEDSRQLCNKVGFHLHQFASNKKEVLADLPPEDRADSVKRFDTISSSTPIERTLGVQWQVQLDTLNFSVTLKDVPLTRRSLLSSVCSIFDPLGILSPFVLVGKRILQDICRDGHDWDDPLPEEIQQRWSRWRSQLLNLDKFSLKRCYKPVDFGEAVIREIHHFSDASDIGYGECCYLRQVNAKGEVSCALVMSKARVAPLKRITIPRLELSAAVVAANVGQFLESEMKNIRQYFWTDSKIVLGYITNQSRRFHVFVANRVSQILDASDAKQWSHVRSECNPSDLVSRGADLSDLVDNTLWWHGPSFLHSSEVELSRTEYKVSSDDPEVKQSQVLISSVDHSTSLYDRISKFSSLHLAKTGFAACLRLQRRFKRDNTIADEGAKTVHASSVEELQNAENLLIKLVQDYHYTAALDEIQRGEEAADTRRRRVKSKKGQLFRLDPFKDSNGIIRVGGRIIHSLLPESLKHPVVLPNDSHFTNLVIKQCHEQVQHQGRSMTLNHIRSAGYWIINGASAVAKFISRCVTCRRLRASALSQKMGNLPAERTACEAPFTHCGLDYFGPWYIKNGRKEMKRYGVVFTCLSSRAVHLEVAESLSTDAFINAYRRFVARRGPVRTIFSDCGTNFVGALNEMEKNKINCTLMKDSCEWKLNPPHGSHMGGVWERLIRSIRSILNNLLYHHGRQLDDDSLCTFMVEVEGIMNSRPICSEVLNDVNAEILTPNHILTGKTRVVLSPAGVFVKEDQYCRKRWRRVQYLLNQFWIKWRLTYLQSLQVRSKWQRVNTNLNINDIVIIKDNNQPRNLWKLARVVKTFPGKDNLVRKAGLILSESNLTDQGKRCKPPTYLIRPIQKLVLLLRNDE